jgi:predicted dehydrogenase
MVGQVCRFYPFFQQVKKMVDDGVLGTVFHIDTTYIHNMEGVGGVGNWRFNREWRHHLVGGGCHAVDLARWICGDAEEVHCYGNHFNIPECPTEDQMNANVKFVNGAIGRVMTAIGQTRPYVIRCHVWGTQGTIEGDNVAEEAQFTLRQFSDWKQQMITIPTHKSAKPISNELDHFITCILEDRRPLVDEVEGAKTVATCEAAVQSMATGLPVRVKNDF